MRVLTIGSGLIILLVITGRGGFFNPSLVCISVPGQGRVDCTYMTIEKSRTSEEPIMKRGVTIMKKKLAVLGTAIMAAVAITACGGTQTQTTEAETTTQAPTTTEAMTTTADSESQDQTTLAGDTSQEAEAGKPSEEAPELDVSQIKPFAEKVQKAVADKDMKALADLCAFPLYISMGDNQGEEIADKDAFLKLDSSKIFTDNMLKEIAGTDLDTLEQFGVGVILGNDNSIVFNNMNGQAAITGIYMQ